MHRGILNFCVRFALLGALWLVPVAHAELGPTAKQVVVVSRAAQWLIEDSGTDLGTSWRGTSFNDSSWRGGPGVLGYGHDMVRTPVSFGLDPQFKFPTAYFRRKFTVADAPATIKRLLLGVNYDDGFVLYLNGIEILRRNMPAGDILYTTRAVVLWEGERHEQLDLTPHINKLATGLNVLAVEVHQNVRNSPDLVWDMKLQYTKETSLITRGPYLQSGTQTSAVIRWRTDVPNTGRVRYGTAVGSLNLLATETVDATEHVVTLTGLTPGTRYYYSVGTSTGLVLAGDSTDYAFHTHPPLGSSSNTVRFWVIGDGGEFNPLQERMRDAYLAHPGFAETDACLLLGDNAYEGGRDDEYQSALFEPFCGPLRKMFVWPARGNHEDSSTDYFNMFTLPTAGQSGGVPSGSEAYYSFNYGNVHVVCLDSDTSSRAPTGPMFTWLANDLAASTQPWTIAFWHHPPYTKGTHDSDDDVDSSGRMRDMREIALPILEGHGVDLVITGHSHAYERSYLIDGHYGPSSTFSSSMVKSYAQGSWLSGAPYSKPSSGRAPHEGTVYVVAGSSAATMTGPFNHPTTREAFSEVGSFVIEVKEHRLDGRFLDLNGVIRDEFTILKGGVVVDVDEAPVRSPLRVTAPSPSRAPIAIHVSSLDEPARLIILDSAGRRVRNLLTTGGSVSWDGNDASGTRVGAGVYFIVVRDDAQPITRKLVLTR